MKKTKSVLMLMVVFMAINQSLAQITLSENLGLGASRFMYTGSKWDVPKSENKWHFAPSIGFEATMPLPMNIYNFGTGIRAGLFLDSKGDHLKGSNETMTFKETYSTHYVDIPVDYYVSYSGFSVFAGPYVGYGLCGEYCYDYYGSSKGHEKIYFRHNVTSSMEEQTNRIYMNPCDMGLNLGAGYQYKQFTFGVDANIGFTNLQPKEAGQSSAIRKDYSYSNRLYSLKFGYNFESLKSPFGK